MASDSTRWVDLKGIARISKADGNLYVRNMDTNRVTVTQLDRLVDIRTDAGDIFVKFDSGHTTLSTLVHGFRFENKAARDKFVDDVMEVLTGNAPYVNYPSQPREINIDLSTDYKDWQPIVSSVQRYLSELTGQWQRMCPNVTTNNNDWRTAEDYALRPADFADITRIIELVYLAEDVIIAYTRRPIVRPDYAMSALLEIQGMVKSPTK